MATLSEAIDAVAPDAKAIDHSAIDVAALEAKVLDAKVLEVTTHDAKAPDAKALDAKALEAKALEACAIEGKLAASARRTGQTWAVTLRDAIVNERRSPCGGWPGTMSEARARVLLAIQAGSHHERAALSAAQREGVARLIYSTARRTWFDLRAPEPPDGPDSE